MEHLTLNIDSVNVRHETLHGKSYTVIPMVMITHGVHAGSQGPLYYPEDELKKTPVIWNHKPIVVYHPEINGQGCSACDPVILETRSVGIIMNTRYEDGKLKADAWIESGRPEKIDPRIAETIQKKKPMEVSTGLFTDNEAVTGEWNGKKYSHIARNYRPDHLAILPDKKGACSMEDGAGLLMNEGVENDGQDSENDGDDGPTALSFREIELQIGKLLSKSFKAKGSSSDCFSCYPEEIYEDYFVYRKPEDGSLLAQSYTTDNGMVEFTGASTSVVKVTEYRTPSGDFVGNAAVDLKELDQMEKKVLIDQLVANTRSGWAETDRPLLETLEEAVLQRMVANAGEAEDDEEDDEEVETDDSEVDDDGEPIENMSAEQYIAMAPPGIREMLIQGLAVHNVSKQELVTRITSNSACRFTKDQLAAKSITELQAIADLAAAASPAQPIANQFQPQPLFFGQAVPGGAPVINQKEQALPLPKIDWGKKS